jgi:hypothetical protein
LRNRQNALTVKIDEENITPSDFAIFAWHLPSNKNEEEVKEYFESLSEQTKVVYVNFAYDI